MTQPEKSYSPQHFAYEPAVNLACGRAAADVDASKDRQQGNIVAFLQQVAVVEEAGIDGAGACYLVLTGAHGADLRIVVCIATDGRVGWALV